MIVSFLYKSAQHPGCIPVDSIRRILDTFADNSLAFPRKARAFFMWSWRNDMRRKREPKPRIAMRGSKTLRASEKCSRVTINIPRRVPDCSTKRS